jgi:N-acetylglucosamine-6-phosphate deacetylase
MLTVAPEAATPAQIGTLARAGVIVSLGHSDCTDAEAAAAFAGGARAVTHLFNAMSQLSSRAPGLVGAALASDAACGLIADGIHVAPTALRVALAARPEGMFLVSDCMAIAGTEMTEMTLGQRRILRRDGRLTLADGTLAGADLTLPRAIGYLVNEVGLPAPRALAMASATPARVIGRADTLGHLAPGRGADFVHLGPDWSLQGVWRAGQRL